MNRILDVHQTKPEGFNTSLQVAACYIEIGGKLLLLQRALGCSEANAWGVPAGKFEAGETAIEAARRELFEETGISVESQLAFQSLGSLYIRKPTVDYIYHSFKVHLDTVPDVRLSDEHQNYTWATSHDLQQIDLMAGAKESLANYYERTSKKRRAGASVNAYLILRRNNEILLLLRKNTGYFDDYYGLVAGHVEDGESATNAMIREAHEEAGIHLLPDQLQVVHVMHRKTDRFNMDVFFECHKWQGTICNREPHKCGDLVFFPVKNLPANMMDYVAKALTFASQGVFYSEFGWKDVE